MSNTCPACKSTNTKDASIRENNGKYGPGAASWIAEEKSMCNECGLYFKPMGKNTPMASEPTIADKNRTICEFTGWEFKQDGAVWVKVYYEGRLMWADDDKFVKKVLAVEFNYHEDWNKLMRVWFKIQTLGADMGISFKKFHEAFHAGIDHRSIEKCHKAVHQFITWYNQQKQTK